MALAPLERAQLHHNSREDYRLIQSIEGGCLQDFDDALLAGASIEATDMGRSLLEISQHYQRPGFARQLLARGAAPTGMSVVAVTHSCTVLHEPVTSVSQLCW